jgi:hypothetical protein
MEWATNAFCGFVRLSAMMKPKSFFSARNAWKVVQIAWTEEV